MEVTTTPSGPGRRFLTQVRLKNYKSIKSCDVSLGPLTFLAGPNGAGKSNFLDALRFVADGLRYALDHALRDRGGISQVRRRSTGHPTHFGISLGFQLPDGGNGEYGFEIAAQPEGGYSVRRELCRVHAASAPDAYFEVRDGEVRRTTARIAPPASPDRLYLVNAAGLSEFKPAYTLLSGMGFYNLNPARIRDLQNPDAGDLLERDGSNLASVLRQMARRKDGTLETIVEFMKLVVPGVERIEPQELGPKETIGFWQGVEGADKPWNFPAQSMSDGTLRALGVLVSLFQSPGNGRSTVPFVGIEEPEAALHPAAAEVLLESLLTASRNVQVAVTSHSPELLDSGRLPVESILAVVAANGITQIAPVDQASREALSKHLYTAGELLRMDQLRPDPELVSRSSQMDLFEGFER